VAWEAEKKWVEEVVGEEEEGEAEACKVKILPNLLHIYSFQHNIPFGNANILSYDIAFCL